MVFAELFFLVLWGLNISLASMLTYKAQKNVYFSILFLHNKPLGLLSYPSDIHNSRVRFSSTAPILGLVQEQKLLPQMVMEGIWNCPRSVTAKQTNQQNQNGTLENKGLDDPDNCHCGNEDYCFRGIIHPTSLICGGWILQGGSQI